MSHTLASELARRRLDESLAPLHGAARPPRGWVRAIRDALGMTTRQMAKRMGVSQPTVTLLEQSEIADTITLKTLRTAAEALDCQLVYALVPRTTLENTVRERLRAYAQTHLAHANHSMRLEDQDVSKAALTEELERLMAMARAGRLSRIWDEP